ncbi:MAG TPA: CARDB domain-containing protein [Candidatus Thermoplasmatota archaeon]|nr:CARDB domain-containing protein [Candidatus Thermoplasmatota archaeon]
MRRAAVLLALAILLPAGAATTPSAVISTADFAFSPKIVLLAGTGEVVRWTNPNATVNHTVTSEAWPRHFDAGVGRLASTDLAFATAGTYPYLCRLHPVMKGTIVVGPNSAPAVATTFDNSTPLAGIVRLEGTAPDAEGPNAWVRIFLANRGVVQGYGIQTNASSGWAWSFDLDTRTFHNGKTSLRIQATDGHLGSEVRLNVTLANPLHKDIAITNVTHVQEATQVRVNAQVSNRGNAPTGVFTATFSYRVDDEDRVFRSVWPLSLAGHSMMPLTATLDAKGKIGTFVVSVVGDPANAVAESDETNNRGETTFTLLLAGPPTDLLER